MKAIARATATALALTLFTVPAVVAETPPANLKYERGKSYFVLASDLGTAHYFEKSDVQSVWRDFNLQFNGSGTFNKVNVWKYRAHDKTGNWTIFLEKGTPNSGQKGTVWVQWEREPAVRLGDFDINQY